MSTTADSVTFKTNSTNYDAVYSDTVIFEESGSNGNTGTIHLSSNGTVTASGTGTIDGAITGGGTITLNGSVALVNHADINGTVILNGSAAIRDTVTIIGSLTAKDSSTVAGVTVTGNVNVQGSAGLTGGTVTGNISVAGSATVADAAITGNVAVSGGSLSGGSIAGNVVLTGGSNSSPVTGTIVVNSGASNSGSASGSIFVIGAGTNSGTLTQGSSGSIQTLVEGTPAVLTQPEDVTITEGDTAPVLTVVAYGATSYAWSFKHEADTEWTLIDGANEASLTLTGLTNVADDQNKYRCTLTGASHNTYSREVLVTVNAISGHGNGAYSTGYYTGGVLDTGYTSSLPLQAQDNSKYYTYAAGVATAATGAYSNGIYNNDSELDTSTVSTPTKAQDNGDFYLYANGISSKVRNGTVAGYSVTYSDGHYRITGDVLLNGAGLSSLPDFGGIYVSGSFNCDANQLTGLQGAPSSVGGTFLCSYNQLTSLQYAPAYVGGNFNCQNNQLTSLVAADNAGVYWIYDGNLNRSHYSSAFTDTNEDGSTHTITGYSYTTADGMYVENGIPYTGLKEVHDLSVVWSGQYGDIYDHTDSVPRNITFVHGFEVGYTLDTGSKTISGTVDLGGRNIIGLQLSEWTVTLDFNCSGNQLTSLQGAPASVGGDFYCNNNQLISLQGAPASVGGYFYCYANQLTSLQYAPSSVGGSFNCNDNQLTSLEGAPASVGGSFYCYVNQLTSLQGAPASVGGGFHCQNNQLTSLQGAPAYVGGWFDCGSNQLTSLQGAPASVGGGFNCSNNTYLTSLQYAPCTVGGNFYTDITGFFNDQCGESWGYSGTSRAIGTYANSDGYYINSVKSASYTTTTPTKARDTGDFYTYSNGTPTKVRNGTVAGYTVTYSDGHYGIYGNVVISSQSLTSLPDFSDIYVNGDFDCRINQLTSLEGAPSSVGADFICDGNQLTSLQYAPSSVSGDFYCYNNQLTSLEYAPSSVGGLFSCHNNQLTSLVATDQSGVYWHYSNNNRAHADGVYSTAKYTDGVIDATYTSTTPAKAQDNGDFYTYSNGTPTKVRNGTVTGYSVTYSAGHYRISGNVDISSQSLTSLPDFSDIYMSGYFYCYGNQLTSLEGAPSSVGGFFHCGNNQLTSLEGAPASVGGVFDCNNNQLTSLQGAPASVGGGFYCYANQLTSLQYAPSSVGGDFYCYINQLTSLQYAPAYVGGDFQCSNNQLTSLQYAPASVGGAFHCGNNQLTSLQYAPSSVGGSFYCYGNQLTSLEYAPSSVGGDFQCGNNPLTSPIAADQAGVFWSYSNNTRAHADSVYSTVKYTDGVIDATYTTTTPTKDQINGDFYTFSNGTPTKVRNGTVAGYTVTYSAGHYRISGNVDISSQILASLPDFSDIYVGGYFYCYNIQLTSLEGAPASVGGDFQCQNNQLTNLEGAPASVGGYFSCSSNQLTSLQGAPSSVGGDFDCLNNPLTSLVATDQAGVYWSYANFNRTRYTNTTPTLGGDGKYYTYSNGVRYENIGGYQVTVVGQQRTITGDVTFVEETFTTVPDFSGVAVTGSFTMQSCGITSLSIAPASVGGNFDCSSNSLTSLQGCPSTIPGEFNCGGNQLTSLQYGPTSVGLGFFCNNNSLTSMQYAPSTLPQPGNYDLVLCGNNTFSFPHTAADAAGVSWVYSAGSPAPGTKRTLA